MADRPKHATREMRFKAAETTVDALIEAGHVRAVDAADCMRDLAAIDCGPFADGYSIARELDDAYGWECNMRMAEILDRHSSNIRDEIAAAEKAWFEQTKPQPPLPIGARLQLGRDGTGEITGIYEYRPAKYCVKIDGDPSGEPPTNSRRIINFEDAVAA